jgi:hypothetical protein
MNKKLNLEKYSSQKVKGSTKKYKAYQPEDGDKE